MPIDEELKTILKSCSVTKQILGLVEYVNTFSSNIENAVNLANEAKTIATGANANANNALTTANEALGFSKGAVQTLGSSPDGSTVKVYGDKADGSQTYTNMPVASELQAGVMNPATYRTVQSNTNRITSLENSTLTYIVVLPNTDPTQDEINNVYHTAYPLAPYPPLDGTTVIDIDKQLFYRYVKNGTLWIKTTGFTVSNFTNETPGLIKGSTTPGQIQAETDGTGSLVGYDNITASLTTLQTGLNSANELITQLQTKNTEQDTAIANAKNTANNAYASVEVTPTASNVELNFTKNGGTSDPKTIPAVTTSMAGLMTPTMYNDLNKVGSGNTEITKFQTIQNSGGLTVQVRYKNNFIDLFKLNQRGSQSGGFTAVVNPLDTNASLARSGFCTRWTGSGGSAVFVPLNTADSTTVSNTSYAIYNLYIGDLADGPGGYKVRIAIINYKDTILNQYIGSVSVTYPSNDYIKVITNMNS